MKQKLECDKCHKHFKMLADRTCATCDPEHWHAFFKKRKGKEGNQRTIK